MATSSMAGQVGRVLGGRYRLVAAIGRGGSATVFLAEDLTLGRRVAVKVLHPALADDETFLRRFRAEAQQAAALNHPHIMRVYDWGESDGGPYLVLEHLSGGSVRDMLDRGHRLSVSQALLVGLHTARGLDYAHRRGLVHRDVKPANLLFDEEGRLAIADFGVARALAEAAWTEPVGAMVGTVRYASPEQAQGAAVDGKADVYALALVMVEAVTGRVPFASDTTIATLMARVGVGIEAPAELGLLAPIVEQAGAADREQRPDARQLARALDRAAESLPAPSPLPLSPPEAGRAATGGDDGASDLSDATRPVVHDVDSDRAVPGPAGDLTLPSRRRAPRWAVLAAVVVAVVVLGAVTASVVARSRRPTHPVPALEGKTLAEGRALGDRFELDVEVAGQRFEEEVPLGVIVDQDPSLGRIREGSTIEVVLSRGPRPRPVPDLAGVDQTVAEARLREAGFVPKVARRHSEDQPRAMVLDWSPRGELPKGAEVVVTVSDGPRLRRIPDVSGRSFEEAAQVLATAGLRAARAETFSDTVERGKVVSTRPAPNSEVPRDSAVTVVVSRGPDLVAVPNVAGRSVSEAQAVLSQTGLPVVNVFGPLTRPVFATAPAAGATVRRGSGVSLYTR